MGAALAAGLTMAAEPAGGDPLLSVAIAAVLGGGLLTGLAALLRGRSGAQLDVASAAKVLIDELRIERDEARAEIARHRARIDELENALAETRREIDRLRAELAARPGHS